MKKRNKRRRESQLDEMLEWQQNQYSPGHYYPEGKTIPGVSGEGNLKLKAIVYTIIGTYAILGSIAIILSSFFSDGGEELIFYLVFGFFILVCIWEIIVHWRKYFKRKAETENRKRRRKKYKKR